MFHDDAQDLRFQGLPLGCVGFGDGDEIGAQKDARHAGQAEQRVGERADQRRVGVREIGGTAGQNRLAGQEFERCRVRRAFGFDEHGSVSTGESGPVRSACLKIGVFVHDDKGQEDASTHALVSKSFFASFS